MVSTILFQFPFPHFNSDVCCIPTILFQFPFPHFNSDVCCTQWPKRSFILSWNAICPDLDRSCMCVCVGEWGLPAGDSCACREISGTIRRKKQNSIQTKKINTFQSAKRKLNFISPNGMWNREFKKIMEAGKYKQRLWVSFLNKTRRKVNNIWIDGCGGKWKV